jgi:hypothetical protein
MTGRAARGRWDSFAARHANNFGVVLLLVIATYSLGSLLPFEGWQGVVIGSLGVCTAVYALAAAGVRPRLMRWVLLAAALEILLAVVSAIADVRQFEGGAALVQTLLFLLAALAVLRAVLTEEDVRAGSIAGAISVYIMLGLLYAFVYVAVDRVQSEPFFGAGTHLQEGDFLFFSMTTLTTTGYGNLVPAVQPGRMLAALEMLTGQIFVVTLVARLVTSWHPGEWLRGGAGITRRGRHPDS